MHPALVLAVLSSLLISVNAQTTCNATTACPEDTPCCSEYGFCGTDNFCLGGCNPLHSFSLDSCRPNPICQNATYTFADDTRILSNITNYDGNTTEYDWTVDKGNISITDSSELAIILTEDNGGTRLSSTRYVHYGTITTKMKTGRWAGVVSAFITMSDIRDEIDWEFPGNATTEGQTNYFWQGLIPTKTNGNTTDGLTDTYSNYHDFTIDWQPTTLTFSIDGNVVRTVQESDTVVDGVSQFPNTPSRIQLSLWPAGINTSSEGVVEWAGGMINWDDPDYQSAGHFYSLVKSVEVVCADPVKPTANITAYEYEKNVTLDTPEIQFTNASTLLDGAVSLENASMNVLFMSVLFVATLVVTL